MEKTSNTARFGGVDSVSAGDKSSLEYTGAATRTGDYGSYYYKYPHKSYYSWNKYFRLSNRKYRKHNHNDSYNNWYCSSNYRWQY